MGHRWVEDDPFDDGDATFVDPSDESRTPGVASVLGLGSVARLLLMVLTAIALVD